MVLVGGVKVNINNYSEVFKNYSQDVREVIRSAILDDTPIEKYIGRYYNNPYLLWQIKLAIDEGLDSFWFDVVSSGNTLYSLRELVRRGINIKPLEKYFSKGLSESHYNYIIKWYTDGYVLDGYNFDILPDDLLEAFDYGISLGCSMSIFNNGVHFSREYIMCCLKIMYNGYSVERFLDGSWNIENMELLSRYSKSRYYEKLINYVSKEITPSVLEEFYECSKVGMSLKEISSVDSSGIYVYSAIHISKIREAYLNDWDYASLLDINLSVKELNSMLDNMKYLSMKKVSGRLRKN